MTDLREITADDEQAGERTDRWLTGLFEEFSRSRLKALIEEGQLLRDGQPMTDPSAKVIAGAHYALTVPAPRPDTPQPEKMDLDILHEDADLIVLLKPCGLAVHPAAGTGAARWSTACCIIAPARCRVLAGWNARASCTGSTRTRPASWWSPSRMRPTRA